VIKAAMEFSRMAALNTPQCHAASSAHNTTNIIAYWLFGASKLLVLLAAMPWLFFLVTQITKF
jgi:hypothetical protein